MKLEDKFAKIFDNVNGGSFVGIDTLTDVPLLGGKKNPQQGRVQKRTVGNQVMVFQNKKSSRPASNCNPVPGASAFRRRRSSATSRMARSTSTWK